MSNFFSHQYFQSFSPNMSFSINVLFFQELYSLQRSQMKARHQKELDGLRRSIQEEEDRLTRELSTNRKNRPKSLRAESKASILMFKESLHIDYPVCLFCIIL